MNANGMANGKAIHDEKKECDNFEQTPSFRRQVFCAILGWSTTFFLGLTVGFISVGMDSLKVAGQHGTAPFAIGDSDIGLFASCFAIGCMVGSFASSWATRRFGRKWPSIATVVPYSGSWLLMAFSTSFTVLLVGITINGMAVSFREPIARMHISEMAFPRYRGRLVATMFTFSSVGATFEYIFALCLDWQGLAFLNAAVPVALVFAQINIPESHVWLISVGKLKEAKKSLQYFYGDKYDSAAELSDSEAHFQETKDAIASFKDIFRFHYLKPVFMVAAIMIIRSNCGSSAVRWFMSQIFRKAKSGVPVKYAVITLGFIELSMTLVGGYVMDKLGRRKALFLSGIIMAVAEAVMGVYLYFLDSPEYSSIAERYSWVPLVCLSFTMVGFSLGIGPSVLVMMGELMPIQIKNAVNGILNAWSSVSSLSAVASFHALYDTVKPCGTFWMYSACCVLLVVLVYILVPETKGHSLAEIERKVTNPKFRKDFSSSTDEEI